MSATQTKAAALVMPEINFQVQDGRSIHTYIAEIGPVAVNRDLGRAGVTADGVGRIFRSSGRLRRSTLERGDRN